MASPDENRIWPLISDKRYAEAVDEYSQQIEKTDPNDQTPLLTGRAHVLMLAGEYQSARQDFLRNNELFKSRKWTGFSPCAYSITRAGVCEWLAGRRAEAIATIGTAVFGKIARSIKYGDAAGGVSQGLLLWYVGVATGDESATGEALTYLRRFPKKYRGDSWPAVLALFLTDRASSEDVLKNATGFGILREALANCANEEHKLKWRQLTQSMLYIGAKERIAGNESWCTELMELCWSKGERWEIEWFLAAAEVGKQPLSGSTRD